MIATAWGVQTDRPLESGEGSSIPQAINLGEESSDLGHTEEHKN